MKKDTIKQINLCAKVVFVSAGIILTILHFVPNSNFPKIGAYLTTILLAFVPDIIRNVLKIKMSDELAMAYYIFLIPAMLMGIDLDLYRAWPPLDKIAHGSSGILAGFAANELFLQGIKDKKHAKTWLRVSFIICFAAFTAAIWECFEFTMDKFVPGSHMQQLISVGLDDTMFDIISALIGGVFASVLITSFEKKK